MAKEMINIKNEIMETWNKVASKFGKVGPNYWGVFGRRLVALADINKGDIILDIGFGRGASLFPAAEKIGENGKAIGIDISIEMVKETQHEVECSEYKNIVLMNCDAEKLEFDDENFDVVLCGFGIGYLMQNKRKLDEVYRVLKHGGQAAFSVWAEQEDNKWLVELVGKYLPVNTPVKKSETQKQQRFDTSDGIREIFMLSGFKDVITMEEEHEVVYKDEEEWWHEMWSNAVRGSLEKIRDLGQDKLEEFKSEAFQGLQKYKKDYGICFNRKVIYAFGCKLHQST